MASIKIPTVIQVCKHTVLYILHMKCGLVKNAIQCLLAYFLLPRKPNLGISDSIHGCLHSEVSIGNVTAPVLLCSCKHFNI